VGEGTVNVLLTPTAVFHSKKRNEQQFQRKRGRVDSVCMTKFGFMGSNPDNSQNQGMDNTSKENELLPAQKILF
jgi:hypothetical protein